MKCEECCYYWQDENERRPRCHWEACCPGDMAPCEYETMETADDPRIGKSPTAGTTKPDSTPTKGATPGTAEAVPFSSARGRASCWRTRRISA